MGQWLQVDLGEVKVILKVATQGRYNSQQFVTSYKMALSTGGDFEFVLSERDGEEKVFVGNVDQSSVVENCIDRVQAQFVRIYPQTWNNHMSMRWDVYVEEYGT